MSEQEIVFQRKGSLGTVLLNRPKALNALTHEMCVAFAHQLSAWEQDDAIKAVLIRGAGHRAFCAGGDIRKLYEEGRAGGDYPFRFYRDEYRVNAHIKRYRKPFVAFLDGITMGGGVGFSIHGTRRIATENTLFAMPETGIGLFPDVGGTHFLPRCPGQIGMYLALTGARIKAADCLFAGLCDAHLPSRSLDELEAALVDAPNLAAIDAAIARFAAPVDEPPLRAHRPAIDRHFAASSVEAILASLAADDSAFAQEAAATLRTKSPTSMKIAYRQVRVGAGLDMDECMRTEWRIVNRVIRGHDFYEGVRAVIVDKDQKPAWRPAMLEDVGSDAVDRYFAPLPGNELPLP